MIGPVGNTPPGAETIRLPTERVRAQGPAVQSQEEADSRAEAATEAARTNAAAIVPEVADLAEALNAKRNSSAYLRIEQDEGTGRFVYKSVDSETGEVVREWPEEEMRRALKQLGELRGVLVNRSA